MNPLRSTVGPGAAAAGCALVLATVMAQLRGAHVGLPLDDAWIHAAFARHLANSGEWGLFAGSSSGGESSLLWPIVLSVGEFGGASLAPRLGLLLGALAFLIVPGLTGRLASSPSRARAVAILTGLCGPLLFAGLSGMETMPALACALLSLGASAEGRPGRAAAWAGLGSLLRPDLMLLLVVLIIARVDELRARGRSLSSALIRSPLALWPGLLLAVLAVLGLAWLEGNFPPSTLGGRRWLLGLDGPPTMVGGAAGIAALLREWGRALVADLGLGRWLENVSGRNLWLWLWKAAAALALLSGLLVVLRRARADVARAAPRSMLLWMLLTIVFYGFVLPDRGHAGRYQIGLYPLVVLLAVEGVASLAMGRRMSPRGMAARIAACLLVLGLSANLMEVGRLWADAVRHINRVHLRMAYQLDERVGAFARVAVFDVGAIGYAYGGPVVDLSGLSDPEVTQAVREGRVPEILDRKGVTHVLLPVLYDDRAGSLRDRLGLLDHPDLHLETVDELATEPDRWSSAFRFSGHAFRRLRLYEVTRSTAAHFGS